MGRSYSPSLILSFLLLILTVVSSCSVGEYLSAYFNTYYNASRLFTEAEEEIVAQPPPREPDTTFLPPYNVPASTKTKLTSVVEKCSKILQYDAESSLVDDALMMIGKSYYYQNEHQRAERKFAELINGYPESSLVPEAEILLAQTFYRMNDKERAREEATGLADSTGGDFENISARAFLLLGQLQYESSDFAGARRSYLFAAEFGEESALRADAYMRAAGMSERLERLDDALEEYEDAEDESDSFNEQFRAKMGQVDVLTRQSDFGEALERLHDIRVNANFSEYFPEVDLQTAATFEAEGELEDAIDQYYYVDTTYARTRASARSHLALGMLYESKLGNYDAARAVYVRGRTQSAQDPSTQIMIRRGDYLRRHKTYTESIAKLESLKVEILNSGSSVDSLLLSPGTGADSTGDSTRVTMPKRPLPTIDSVESGLARNKADLGGLFFVGLELEDSSKFWYEKVLREHPGSAYEPKALYTIARISESQKVPKEVVDSLYLTIVEEYPSSVFAAEARRILGHGAAPETEDPAVAIYDEAQGLLEHGEAEEAIARWTDLVTLYPESDLAPKAQFAIAWTYNQGARPDSALVHFRKVVEQYPATTYGTAAFNMLRDLPPEEVRRIEASMLADSAAPDSTIVLPDDSGDILVAPLDSTVVDTSGVGEVE